MSAQVLESDENIHSKPHKSKTQQFNTNPRRSKTLNVRILIQKEMACCVSPLCFLQLWPTQIQARNSRCGIHVLPQDVEAPQGTSATSLVSLFLHSLKECCDANKGGVDEAKATLLRKQERNQNNDQWGR